jgi:hypothetical protein
MVEQKANRLEGGGYYPGRCPGSLQRRFDRGFMADKSMNWVAEQLFCNIIWPMNNGTLKIVT